MTDAATSAASPSPAVRPSAAHHAAKPSGGSAFRRFLSELNPLQYIPVVGTIYRAVTGDTIPETARMVGSLVVSGLEGGPVGIAMNVAITALEKLTGIDPERIGTRVLAELGIGSHRTPVAPAPAPVQVAWSPTQLRAYDVGAGEAPLRECDVLNEKELARLRISAVV